MKLPIAISCYPLNIVVRQFGLTTRNCCNSSDFFNESTLHLIELSKDFSCYFEEYSSQIDIMSTC